jgi:hypothetical protein
MPIFAPFSYLSNPIPPAWTPESFSDVQYWWRADLGVTETGTGVSAWEDQINGFTMQQSTDSSRPTLTTNANLNGQSVIRTNGTSDYLYTLTTPAARTTGDYTFLTVHRIINTGGNSGIIFGVSRLAGNPNSRIWIDTLSNNQRFFATGMASATGTNASVNYESPMTISNTAFKGRYDQSLGDTFYAYNTLSESTLGTSGVTGLTGWPTDATVCIGASVIGTAGGIFLSRYAPIDIAEAVMIYGEPSTDEMNDWKSYVNNRYGTIIS